MISSGILGTTTVSVSTGVGRFGFEVFESIREVVVGTTEASC